MTAAREDKSSAALREWVPVREKLPEVDGEYDTLVKPALEDESYVQRQLYVKQAHSLINGWQFAFTTHWRPNAL